MVAIVAVHNLSEPRTDSGNRLVHAEAQFCFQCVQLRHHALLRRFPPDGERSVAPALPAEVREAQERNRSPAFLHHASPGLGRRTAQTRSVAFSLDVVPVRTWPVDPETLSGIARLPFGFRSP